MDEVKHMKRFRDFRRQNEWGQAMLEMALVLPLLLALVFGIIEFGNIYSHQLEVTNLARHSVRVAIVASDITAEADNALEGTCEARMPGADVEITRNLSDVTATVDYDVTLITGQILGLGTKHLSAEATMKAE